MNRHVELEYKFKADHVPLAHFQALLQSAQPDAYEVVNPHDDVYYKRGSVCVRHRTRGELTVKARTNPYSIKSRVEINLNFSPDTTKEDVEAFLLATGYERLFSLRKKFAHVFCFEFHGCVMEVCMYEVGRVDNWGISNVRQFIEIEMKNKSLSFKDAEEVLDSWKDWFQFQFGLAEPLNESLLEIYTPITSPSTNFNI